MNRPLDEYHRKRDFAQTPEPAGDQTDKQSPEARSFTVQKHAATRLHWDLRLEWDGVLLSWAVTRGPSADVKAKRLAVRTEDHPLDYATFEGTIPKPLYGAGTVMLWDQGTWAPLGDVNSGLADGMLKFVLSGERMRGAWMLVRMKPRKGEKRENWLLIKERDAHASDDTEELVTTHMTSVATGRDMAEITKNITKKSMPREKTTKAPPFRPVQLAKLQTDVPLGDDWLHEVKVDGYRCLAAYGAEGVKLYTRSGLDWTTQFGALLPAFGALPCKSALIDGEVVAAGVESHAFSTLQHRLKNGGPLAYVAFDLLYLDGRDLTKLPLMDRKAKLERLLENSDPALRYSTHIEGHGAEAWAQVCAAGREGLISKLATSPYHAGRHGSWIKLKCGQRQEFVIGGWIPSASRGRPFASLLMGSFEGKHLVYRGRVGTGFGTREFDELVPLLEKWCRKTSPFADARAEVSNAHWVTPNLVAEIKFTELTAAGHIRHGTYQALRQDKQAKGVSLDQVEEVAADAHNQKGSHSSKISGVTITHPDRQVFDTPAVPKRQVAQHYADFGERMMPFLRNRPVSLLRCPDGIAGQCFFQKHRGDGMPRSVGSVAISDNAEDADYITLATPTGLVAAAQMGTIEFHIWGSRNSALEKPDRIVFDLDPDEAVPFPAVRQAALDLHDLLGDLDLPSIPMLTGGKGIHVIVPLLPKAGWDTVKLFSRTIAVMLSDREPHRFIATMSKAKRKGLIFIDWLRNDRSATAIAPYALRARPGAKVAVPLTWEEIRTAMSAGQFCIASVRTRLTQPCPLQDATKRAVYLDEKVLKKLERQVNA
ncbi:MULTISPECIES: DNA ligase D [unclassified Yoonia]|uniref:DNA ligase D n=1 Tax=unclassified Yoonia TaxID=2629118 RepID=UPI002AFEB642|nr:MULTISPECIES: DNA ligase D [unclassified Yoonia]